MGGGVLEGEQGQVGETCRDRHVYVGVSQLVLSQTDRSSEYYLSIPDNHVWYDI